MSPSLLGVKFCLSGGNASHNDGCDTSTHRHVTQLKNGKEIRFAPHVEYVLVRAEEARLQDGFAEEGGLKSRGAVRIGH